MIIKKLAVARSWPTAYRRCNETHEAAVIDPGDEADRYPARLAQAKLTVKQIHPIPRPFDHVGAATNV